jgi:hypothetical protein
MSFKIEPNHNVTIATRIAQVIYAKWPTPIVVSGDTLSISEPLPMKWTRVTRPVVGPAPVVLSHDLARAFVGVTAPTSKPMTTNDHGVTRHVVETSGGVPDALDRFLRVPGVDLIEVAASGKQTTLTVAPLALRPQSSSSSQTAGK